MAGGAAGLFRKYSSGGSTNVVRLATDTDAIYVVDGTVKKPGGGSWSTTSDIRLKDVQGSFTRSLNDLIKLNPIKYNYKKDNAEKLPSDKSYIGLSAQEVQKAIPEAVSTDSQGYLQLNNDPIIFTMLNAVKELYQSSQNYSGRIAELEIANKELRVQNEQLETRMQKLENSLKSK